MPLIYRVMNQLGPDSPNFGQSPEILQSLGPFVQQLIIYSCSEDYLLTFLYACPNVHHLMIHLQMTAGGTFALNRLLLRLQWMTRLTHLTAALNSLWGFSHGKILPQAYLNITHLDVYVSRTYLWKGHWEILTHLPKLTHLLIIVRYILEVKAVVKLLQFCPVLEILACMIPHHFHVGNYDALERVDDNRLVLLDGINYANTNIDDWGRAPKGCVGAMIVSECVVFTRDSEY
jgi:hypothetical protein